MAPRKQRKKKPEYGFHIEYRTVHGIESFPVKVYDPEPTPDGREAAPRLVNSQDLTTAGLDHLVEVE